MKIRLFAVILLLLAISLSGCVSSNESNSGGNTDKAPADYGSATVFAPGDSVQMIAPSAEGRALLDHSAAYLDPMLRDGKGNGGTGIGSQYSNNAKLEFIVGLKDESRPATVTAYKLLERMERESYFDMRYLVYAFEGCIAVAYDKNEYTTLDILEVIDEALIAELFANKEYVAYPKGIIMSGNVDLIEEQELLDAELLSDQWTALEGILGTEATDAARILYSIYDDDMVGWIANLYDPGIGGFYASSGGRDGAEFGPDVQCTVQLLKFIVSSGMVDNIGSDWREFVPEFMQQQMIYFAKSLQDSKTGYFYHPQWGKEATDQKISRRGRDLSWGVSLLEGFGHSPVYTTPSGIAGDGVTADEYWDALVANGEALSAKPHTYAESPKYLLGSGISSAVSMALQGSVSLTAAVDSTTYLNTHEGFINYLLVYVQPGLHSNPYQTGNEVGSTTEQVAVASEKLGIYVYETGDENNTSGAAAADYMQFDGLTIKEMLINVVRDNINPETGLWGDLTATAPLGTEFRYTNGYFKTVGILTNWDVPYPPEYIPKAANALMEGIMGDEPSTTNCCDIYNVWSCVSFLRQNLNLIEDEELRAQINASVDEILAQKAPAAILNTYEKIKGYKKYDGGFAHEYLKGTGAHQGLPVGVAGLNQSDVDGTCISSTGLLRAMFDALRVSEKNRPSMYTESDWMRMLEIFLSQQAVIKYSYDESAGSGAVEHFDFEDSLPESKYLIVTNRNVPENNLSVVKLGDRGVGLVSKPTQNAQLYMDWKPNVTDAGATAGYFEVDLMFSSLNAAKEPVELRVYDGKDETTKVYTLYIYVNELETGKNVYIASKTDTSNKIQVAKIGEWFKLRLAYYEGIADDEKSPAAFKVFINESETPILVDEKFENGGPFPAANFGFARFLTMGAFSGSFYIDNVRFAQEKLDYTYHEPTHNKGGSSTPTTPSTPSVPSGGSTTTTLDGKLTFDGATAFPITADNGLVLKSDIAAGWKGSVAFESEDGNNFIRITDSFTAVNDDPMGDSGQCVLRFYRPAYTGTDTTFVFEGRFRVSPLVGGQYITNDASFDITFRGSGSTRVYRTYFGAGDLGLNGKSGAVKDVWSEGEWFTLRIEYTVVGDSADTASWLVNAYVNNDPVQSSTDASVNSFSDSAGITDVAIILSAYYSGHFDIDDITMYQKTAE